MVKQAEKVNKIELLAPAGDLEKLKYALDFGADAVYCGVPDFSLRVRINRFSKDDLKKAVEYVHARKKKIYVTLNIYAHNEHLAKIKTHILFLKKLKVDAIIASDPGIILFIQKYWPDCEIHLSTQANATNFSAVEFWHAQGVKRIILAREVTLAEIEEIKKKNKNVELEYFVHGAMCMSYSGRCILSKWMTGRGANLGDCSQPCRWAYHKTCSTKHVTKNAGGDKKSHAYRQAGKIKNQNFGDDFFEMSVVDDQRRYAVDVEEDTHGTYFFNSYDMNLLAHLGELRKAGVTSFKIEGRAKSAYYLAIVTRAYRKVIDAVETQTASVETPASPVGRHCNVSLREKIIKEQKVELDNLVHRGYSTGFLLGQEPAHNFQNQNNQAKFQFVGEVKGAEGGLNILRVHNHISLKDKLEAITPKENIKLKLERILDSNKNEVSVADGGHGKVYYFKFDKILESGSLVRKVI